MTESSTERNPVEELAEQFLERRRRGEKPTQADYERQFPELADEIRELFPALLLMEDFKPESGDLTSSFSSGAKSGELPIPEKVGDYRILREIGRGGMGVVYEAEQLSLGRRVALKLLPEPLSGSTTAYRRFHREARAAAQLHHTNIVPVFDVGEDAGRCFYAMQFIAGQSLDAVINEVAKLRSGGDASDRHFRTAVSQPALSIWEGEFVTADLSQVADTDASGPQLEAENNGSSVPRETRSSNDTTRVSGSATRTDRDTESTGLSAVDTKRQQYCLRVARLGLQAADALDYAHNRGILHRDVKPSNLLLDKAGVLWVTDFGLAKTDEEDVTRTGDIVGTLRYMAPERLRGQCDARSDVYSLGITLYELLTLRTAFEATDRLQLINAIVQEQPPLPRFLDRSIPRDLETVVLKAIDKEPRRRYQTAAQLREDLRRFIADEPICARRVSLAERTVRWARHNKTLAASLVATFLLLLLYAVSSRMKADENAELAAKNARLAQERETARQNEQLERRKVTRQRDDLARLQAQSQQRLYAAEMVIAGQLVWNPARADQAAQILSHWTPSPGDRDLRRWDWYYLLGQVNQAERTLREHTAPVRAVAWSPNGKFWASSGLDRCVILWDAATGRRVRTLPGHRGNITCLTFAPDGSRLAATSNSGEIRIWDLATGHEVFSLRGPNEEHIGTLVWSTDSQRIAWANFGGAVHFTDVQTGREERAFDTGELIFDFDWQPASNRIAIAAMSGYVRVYEATSGEFLFDVTRHKPSAYAVAWSPDGTQLASAGADGVVRRWDSAQQTVTEIGKQYFGATTDVEWSPDGTRLAFCGADQSIMVLESVSGMRLSTLTGHLNAVQSVCWSPDGKELLTGSDDWTVRLWEADPSRSIEVKREDPRGLVSGSWSNSVSAVAIVRSDGFLDAWDVLTGRKAKTFGNQDRPIIASQFDDAGHRLAFADADALYIWQWGAQSATALAEKPSATTSFSAIAWSPKGDRIATGHTDGSIHYWGTDRGAEDPSSATELAKPIAMDWSPDGTKIVAADADGRVAVLETASGKQTFHQDSKIGIVNAVAWEAKGNRFAVGGGSPRIWASIGIDSYRGTICVWDLRAPNSPVTAEGHDGIVTAVAWSPDGERLLTSGMDGFLKLWAISPAPNLETPQELFSTHDGGPAVSAGWSRDGFRIVSLNRRGTVKTRDAVRGYRSALAPELLMHLSQNSIQSDETAASLADRAVLHASQGQWENAEVAFRKLDSLNGTIKGWHLTPWWVSGPYPARLSEPFAPEKHGFFPPNSQSRERDTAALSLATDWQLACSDAAGLLDFSTWFGGKPNRCCYATTRIYSLRNQEAGIIFGASDVARLWMNGRMVYEDTSRSQFQADENVTTVSLKEGWNTLLVKVVSTSEDHLLVLRLTQDPIELASAYERGRRYGEADCEWTRAVEAQPDNGTLWLKRCLVRTRLDQDNAAESDFLQALELGHSRLEYLLQRAELYEELDRTDEALQCLSDAIDVAPDMQCLWYKRSSLLVRHEQLNAAEKDLQIASSLAPGDHWSIYRLLPLRLFRGDRAGYLSLRADALKRWKNTRSPNIAERISKSALMYPAEGEELSTATAMAEITYSDNPEHMTAGYYLNAEGLACYRAGDFEGAAAKLSRSLELRNNKDEDALSTLNRLLLAMACCRLGRMDLAANAYSTARGTLLNRFSSLNKPDFQEVGNAWHDWLFCLIIDREAQQFVVSPIEQHLRARALELKRATSLENPATLSALNDLAKHYAAQQQTDQAEYILLRIREIQKKVCGDQHPDTRKTEIALCNLYWEQSLRDTLAGNWESAAKQMVKAHSLECSQIGWRLYVGLRTAAMLAMVRDEETYRSVSSDLVKASRQTKDPALRRLVARACTLLPAPEQSDTRSVVTAIAREVFEAQPKNPWSQLQLGVAEYRSDNLDAATRVLQEAERASSAQCRGQSLATQALIHWKLGKRDEARKFLDRSKALLAATENGKSAHGRFDSDMVIWRVLIAEAETILSGV